jgi:hypothetical protein
MNWVRPGNRLRREYWTELEHANGQSFNREDRTARKGFVYDIEPNAHSMSMRSASLMAQFWPWLARQR